MLSESGWEGNLTGVSTPDLNLIYLNIHNI
jgi:hypothetical protein